MSGVSSPIHRYSADIESLLYDQNFTADISNKMRVPTKILVTGGGLNDTNKSGVEIDTNSTMYNRSSSAEADGVVHDKVNTMQVPDRIILSGHEQHVGAKAPPKELRLEQMMSPQPTSVRVVTPPRVLTLEDHFFPTVDEDSDSECDNLQNRPASNQMASDITSRDTLPAGATNTSLDVSYYGASEDISALRRQVVKLNRRILRLENDSNARQQKEMLVYSLGIAYFVLKTFLWLHRNW